MAEKSFSVKEIQVQGSGTPTIESASGGNLNITAATTTFSGAVEASGGFTINSSSTIHVSESTDAASGFNIPFLLTTDGGGGGRKFQVDNGNFGFRPSDNTLFAGQNINSVSGALTLSGATSSSDVVISALGGTSKGLGYFQFTTSDNTTSKLAIANVAIGYSAGDNSPNPVTGSAGRNTFLGSFSGLENVAGQFNTFLGYSAGLDFRTGSQNVAIGFNAGDGNQSGSNNTYIGANAAASSSGTSNEVVIGNTSITKFKVPGIDFNLKDNGGTPTQGHVLTVDGSGEASFEALSVDGITSTNTLSNLSSASDVMVGVAVGPRFHSYYDSNNQYVLISTGDASGGRNYGTMKIRSGRASGGTSIYGNNSGASINISHNNGQLLINNKSGNFNVGDSGHDGFKFNLDGTMINASESGANANMTLARRNSGNAMEFRENTSVRGSIYIDTSANTTSYNETSDYRIKENIVGITSALDKINQLRPINFNFIGKSVKLDGFLAHEVQAVVPYAVHGDKDAVMTVKDGDLSDDGSKEDADRIAALSTKEIPDLQQLDKSKLIALLTASVQELSAKNDALEARIKTLEGS